MNFFRENLFLIIRYFDGLINSNFRALTEEFSFFAFGVLILISFVYGIVHAAGPGHGKSIVLSFFLKEKHPVSKSLVLALIISVAHTSMALVLSFLLSFVITNVGVFFRIKLQSYFMFASGVMIFTVGVIFLLFKIFEKVSAKKSSVSNDDQVVKSNKSLFLIGISAGIVPCPVSLMIMLLAISSQMTLVGISLVLMMSFGMFSLLSLIGLFSIKSRDAIVYLSRNKKRSIFELTAVGLEMFSVILIIAIGFSIAFANKIW